MIVLFPGYMYLLHMWESQVLLMDGQVFFFFPPGFSGFDWAVIPLMNDQLYISEIFLKGP